MFFCNPQKADFYFNATNNYVENRSGGIIRSVEIRKFDKKGNFSGWKNIYKASESEGSSRIYVFSENKGYIVSGDSLSNEKGFLYEVKLKALGFYDSLHFDK